MFVKFSYLNVTVYFEFWIRSIPDDQPDPVYNYCCCTFLFSTEIIYCCCGTQAFGTRNNIFCAAECQELLQIVIGLIVVLHLYTCMFVCLLIWVKFHCDWHNCCFLWLPIDPQSMVHEQFIASHWIIFSDWVWTVHEVVMNSSWYVHEQFLKCSWLKTEYPYSLKTPFHELFMNLPKTIFHELFMNHSSTGVSWVVHELP